MKLTIDTCISALAHAAINRKAAIQLELSAGLAVFLMNGGTNKDARAQLADAYASAGYRCKRVGEMDYKTVNRRINATAHLFEKVPVKKWVGTLVEMDVIKAICEGLEPYELYTIQDVLRYSAPDKVHVPRTAVKPNADILAGPTATNHSGQDRVMQQFRRASDKTGVEARHLSTEHLSLSVPKDTSRQELIDLAMQIMALAKNDEKELLTV